MLAVLTATLSGGPGHAETEQVFVTAAKLPEAVGGAAFSTVSLTPEQLSVSGRLDEALEQVPGLSLFRRTNSISANASTQGVSLREIAPSGASRALVLLDGIPMNDPFGGWVIWTQLPFEDMGGAEIVRGAGAGPYGAGALTGTILLTERDSAQGIADIAGGTLNSARGGASRGEALDGIDLFASIAGERTNGWIPVQEPDRGAADNHVWFDGGEASLRAQTQIGSILESARIGYYDESRGAGVVGATSSAHGLTSSLSFASNPGASGPGWRLQGWMVHSGFSNTSVSVAPGRGGTTPANDQFATPALGFGGNAALLGQSGALHWEAGADLRGDSGESRELYKFNGSEFSMFRRSGGRSVVAGVYGEGAIDTSQWLLTLGGRGDYWATSQGHLVEMDRATGTITNQQEYEGKHGIVPTARGGIRRNFNDGQYLRAAAYAGFRVPSLNELYRPFRVGNDVTQANANLRPEKLYGAELGWGGGWDRLRWDATLFYNQLHSAIANVTIGQVFCGPVACGTLRQRQNAGDVGALGFESQLTYTVADNFSAWSAVALSNAKFTSGPLDGFRPAQTPRATITGGTSWQPLPKLALDAQLRWEGLRYENDLNTLRLGAALVLDMRATYSITEALAGYVAVDNATDANVATAATQDALLGEVISYGQPRIVWAGITYTE
ncbi:MAG: TonB-dependent receptor [Alphaproteobacteria bacterium]|nr:TonB-dependent receptor [Alphaproteobacteria bacterium]